LPIYLDHDIEYAKNELNGWTCPICLAVLFPFNSIGINEPLLEAINNPNNLIIDVDTLNAMVYDPLEINEDDSEGALSDIDPDQNCLKDIKGTLLQDCKYYYTTDQINQIQETSNKSEFSIFHLNIRSTPKNFDKLIPTLHTSGTTFDILALSETWLKPLNAECYGMEGYTHEFMTRNNRPGGGVSLYITDTWNYKIREDFSIITNEYEMLWIELDKDSTNSNSNIILGVIYRIPGTNPNDFNSKLQEIITKISNEKKECIHVGDYNFNLLNSDTHPPTAEFVNINFTQSLFPSINKPTRLTSNTATLIDNIFISPTFMTDSRSGIFLWDLSDHFPIFFIKYLVPATKEETIKLTRSHCEANKTAFSNAMTNTNWTPVTSNQNAQESYSIFHEIIAQAYNKAFPLKQSKPCYKNRLPWLSQGLKTSIKNKHKLHTTYLRNPTETNKKDYKNFKNKLNHVLRITHRKHIQDELLACKNNMRKSWQLIKEIINKNRKITHKLPKITINGHLCDDPKMIAEGFNNFFTHIGPILDGKIPVNNTSPLSFIPGNYTIDLILEPATELEINQIVDRLKNCAVGWDHFPAMIFKENKDPLNSILKHIVNLSLDQGTFPSELKLANIIPIFKAGDTDMIGNYRPVSLLSTVSKIFERAFFSRLSSFINRFKILYTLQFGFREGHATDMAIIKLLENIINSLESGDYTATIFLDFSKAFDTVNHEILLQKLNHYGIRGTAHRWVTSYLSERKQYCTFGNETSSTTNITCGVPQGSILGPLLFLLYINDLGTIFTHFGTILFADDSNLIVRGNSLKALEDKINQDIPLLTTWLETNRLSLNLKKTHIMVFGKKHRNIENTISTTIKGTTLEIVTHTKFLGVILDNSLSWKEHSLYLSKKISKSIGILTRARPFLNKTTLRQLYFSFLYPYLNYCSSIWGNASDNILWPLFKIQKRAIRILVNLRGRDSTRQSFYDLKLLRLPEIYKFSVLIFVYKFKNRLLPTVFDNFYTENRQVHRYQTRNADQFRTPLTKYRVAANFIKKTGVTIWQELNNEISHEKKIGLFKREVIARLIRDY